MLKAKFPSLTLRERLLLYSNIDEMGCWLWQGTVFAETGYAQVTNNKKVYSGHRLAMAIFKGFNLASKDLILHHCDVKRCINPGHLYVGNRLDNARDAVLRKRQRSGSLHPMAKLNEDKVREIKRMIRDGMGLKVIAKQYDISDSTIGLIKRQKIWTHVKENA